MPDFSQDPLFRELYDLVMPDIHLLTKFMSYYKAGHVPQSILTQMIDDYTINGFSTGPRTPLYIAQGLDKLRIKYPCAHPEWGMESGGDGESGPITTSWCKVCGKTETQFGM